jgi:hypothetical protein
MQGFHGCTPFLEFQLRDRAGLRAMARQLQGRTADLRRGELHSPAMNPSVRNARHSQADLRGAK